MRALIVKEYEDRLNNYFSIRLKELLISNDYSGNNTILEWVGTLFENRILRGRNPSLFETEIGSNGQLIALLQGGDKFYVTLFKENGFITDQTKGKELATPLTNVITEIYNSLFFEERQHHETLIIYWDLRKYLELNIGGEIATNPSLQSFEIWKIINEKLEIAHEIKSGWISKISIKSIVKEKDKFSRIPQETELYDLANLRGYGRDNKREAKNYLQHIAKLRAATPWEYVSEATRNADLLTFKGNICLMQELLYKSGISEWVSFWDSLRFPVLQDHLFLFVDDLDDYAQIIQLVTKGTEFNTSVEHLLLIALQNYFDFIDRTLTSLCNITSERFSHNKNPETNRVIEEAKKEYLKWINELIPVSFSKILKDIFPESELHRSKYYLSFFDWINSYSKANISSVKLKSRIELIDLFNEAFQKLLDKNEEDRHYLVDSLTLNQINWEALKKLVFIHSENKSDLGFADKICNRYVEFMNSEKFSWHSKDEENLDSIINDAYYFSAVVSSYSDAFQKWQMLFAQYKINHEGWLVSKADFRHYYRESFLLTVGAGMAYFNYAEEKKTDADIILFSVLATLIKQERNCGETKSIDYISPLKFIAICIGKFSKDKTDLFISLLLEKFDSLKFVLIGAYELSLYVANSAISDNNKNLLLQRINRDFWTLTEGKSDVVFKAKINYYKQLKKLLLEFCQC